MSFAQWWKRRVRQSDLKFVSAEGIVIYREMCAEAWNAAQLACASNVPRPPNDRS